MLIVAQTAQAATSDLVSTSVAATFANNTHGGSLIVVCCNGGTHKVSSIADSQGNSYVAADTGGFAWSDCEIWYAKNVQGGVTPTITVTLAAAMAATAQVYEVMGADPDSPLSIHGNANGDGATSNNPTVTTGTTGAGYELLVATGSLFTGSGTDVFSAGSGFGNFLALNSTPTSGATVSAGTETMLISPNTYTANFTMAFASTTWEITYATFKELRNFPENQGKYVRVGDGMGRSEVAN